MPPACWTPSTRRRVEEALAARPELRQSLRAVEEERDETIALNQRLGAPRPDILTRVLATAASEPRRPSLASRLASLAGAFGRGVARHPSRLILAAAAAAVVILLESAALLALLPSHSREAYQTASSTEPKRGAEVLIAFAPDARIDAIGAFLKERDASIVEGPRGGMYRIRIGDKPLTKDEMSALLKSLAASPLVRTALPAGGD